jgi:hypothetical protein
MDLTEHFFHVRFRFALRKFREQRRRRFGNATTGADEADVGNLFAVQREEQFQLIAAEGIVSLRRAGGLRHLVKIPRLFAVVKDDLLIKVVDVVEHI